MDTEPCTRPAVIEHSRLLAWSYRRWTGKQLLSQGGTPAQLAHALYQAPFVLVSHGTQDDPLFNYANLAAQRLWELDWAHLVGMPSRKTAEAEAQGERSEALRTALAGGWVEGYSGVRISSSGRRFRIRDGIIWNVLDERDVLHGQAACFSVWRHL